MGLFLSLTSVIGITENDVAASLAKYATSTGGSLEKEKPSDEIENRCVIADSLGNTTIIYPNDYVEWDKSSQFISKDLSARVFSFHIHDGDLWMYVLFVHGKQVDQFNPIPDYWDDKISEDEIRRWSGNAATVSHYLPYVAPADIQKYLVRWKPDSKETRKAYPGDQYGQEDWQLLDFMKKLNLPYPDAREGHNYKLWTNKLPLKPKHS